MSLKSTRKILSVILVIIIAAGGCLLTGTVLLKLTVCSESYIQRHFTSDKVMAQCNENFEARIEALAERSGIPVRAFEAVSGFEEITSDSPVRRLFGGHDTSLYTQETVEKFEQLCTEYLEGNSIEYDKGLVHNTADEAARIYADCYGLKNTDEMSGFINRVNSSYQNWICFGVIMIVAPIALLFVLYKKTYDVMLLIFSAFTAQGAALVMCGALGLITGLGQSPGIYPHMYTLAAADVVRSVFLLIMLVGFAVAAAFVLLNVAVYKKNTKDESY